MRLTVVAVALIVLCTCGSGRALPAAGARIVFAADRLPRAYGEIYRVTADGSRLDLSDSPAPDLAPAVSPDGRRVAFLSGRGGEWAFYVVGIHGRRLRRISPPLFPLLPSDDPQAQIAWAPNGRSLAAELSGPTTRLYLGDGSRVLPVTGRAGTDLAGPYTLAWSRDSRFLAYSTADGSVDVVGATGKRLWSVPGQIGGNAWSADDRLAVSANSSTIRVYRRNGSLVTGFVGHYPTWSPAGTVLASVTPYALQLRRDGSGRPVFSRSVRNVSVQWVSETRLRLFGRAGWFGLDLARNRTFALAPPATGYDSIVSPGGDVAGDEYTHNGSALLVLRTAAGQATTIARGPICPEQEDFADLAFVPHGSALVYQSDCMTPPADIYSIRPDGSALRQLTATPADEMEPSLSPDGRSVVYAQQAAAGRCDGCPQTLWRVSVDGGTPQQLTRHTFEDAAPFDQNPTWSPDGTQIAFQRSRAAAPVRLLTMPADGGTPRDLHVKGAALPAWGPTRIAVANWSIPRLVVETVDPTTGAVHVVATGGRTDAEALAWSSAGRLAYLYDDARGRAFIGIAGSKTKPLDLSAHLPPHARVAGLAWSPDGSRFAFAATDANGLGEIYTIGVDGTGLEQLTRNVDALYDVGYQGTLSWR